ncbi:hypothetical protein Pelo_17954 [Pelomyxa schiedti]|nr:hypothetical protein Pelo_17954 [Pelomyxa schiedti]
MALDTSNAKPGCVVGLWKQNRKRGRRKECGKWPVAGATETARDPPKTKKFGYGRGRFRARTTSGSLFLPLANISPPLPLLENSQPPGILGAENKAFLLLLLLLLWGFFSPPTLIQLVGQPQSVSTTIRFVEFSQLSTDILPCVTDVTHIRVCEPFGGLSAIGIGVLFNDFIEHQLKLSHVNPIREGDVGNLIVDFKACLECLPLEEEIDVKIDHIYGRSTHRVDIV